jgi:hypothetical protein
MVVGSTADYSEGKLFGKNSGCGCEMTQRTHHPVCDVIHAKANLCKERGELDSVSIIS